MEDTKEIKHVRVEVGNGSSERAIGVDSNGSSSVQGASDVHITARGVLRRPLNIIPCWRSRHTKGGRDDRMTLRLEGKTENEGRDGQELEEHLRDVDEKSLERIGQVRRD